MTELLTAAQMRATERAAIEGGTVTGLELMECAGRGVVEAVFEAWPALAATSHRALVLCGPGNNGGDGFVVARLMHEWGWQVDVFLHGDPGRLPPDAAANHGRWRALGEVHPWDDETIADMLDSDRHDLVVDALFGTGLTRPMPGDTERTRHGFALKAAAPEPTRRTRFVAVDMPSGICSDSGRNLGGAFPTDLTVTFHRAKIGHFLSPEGPPEGGAAWCGKVVVKDIGLKPDPAPATVRLAAPDSSGLAKSRGRHKYDHGHTLVLSGGVGRGGAGRLAARGALRIGAGLVTLGCPPAALQENASRLDAVMVRTVKGAKGLASAMDDARINALCLGPGLGLGDDSGALVAAALKSGRRTVLDADALTLISRDPELFAALHEACVLTPHRGEFARLFPDLGERLCQEASRGPAFSKLDATRAAAARAGCTVLFKGPDTVIADRAGRASISAASCDRAAPWLATAGSGDVLAGFVAGLLARGFSTRRAAETAAWLHVECARGFGPGLIAEDLPEMLPQVLRALPG